MEEHFTNFCHMMIEDFLMQKGMQNTLQEFRKEWDRPDEVRKEVVGCMFTRYMHHLYSLLLVTQCRT